MSKIYVPLEKEEWFGLIELAQKECRHPRDQMRHILRVVLFGDQSTNDNTVALDLVNRRDRVVS